MSADGVQVIANLYELSQLAKRSGEYKGKLLLRSGVVADKPAQTSWARTLFKFTVVTAVVGVSAFALYRYSRKKD